MNSFPSMWREYSYDTDKNLGSWIEDLKEKVIFMKNW